MSNNNINIVEDFLEYKYFVVTLFLDKYNNDEMLTKDILYKAIDVTHLMRDWEFLTVYLTNSSDSVGFVLNNTNIINKTDEYTYKICYDDDNCRNFNS